jgi:putative DNA primase/helicase
VTAPQPPAEVPDDPEGLDRNYSPLTDPLASDADMATAAGRALADFRWAGGLGWRWYNAETGAWPLVAEEAVAERVRRFMLTMAAICMGRALEALAGGKDKDGKFSEELSGAWRGKATASRIFAVTRLARGIRYTDPSAFDTHPDLLNVPNGVLDLRTLRLGDHDPDLLFTQVAGAAWVPGATHPDIDKALGAIPSDSRDYAQLRYGQAITGHKPPDDVISVQYAPGENGKTSIMTAIKKAAGDYCAILPSHLLLADPGAHSTDLMTLRGVRLGIIEELPEDRTLSVTRIKIATAPVITARLIRKDNVTFANACSPFISTNYRPVVRETDHGTWRRLEGLIPYPFTFRKPHERIRDANDIPGDPTLRERVASDEDGSRAVAMLAWLAGGAWRWYQGEPGREARTMGEPPQRVRDEVAEWRGSCDLLHGWLAEVMAWSENHHAPSADALAAFNEWARSRGHERWSAELFASRMAVHDEVREHGVYKKITRDVPGCSRPSWMALEPLKKQYAAWFGLMFQNEFSQVVMPVMTPDHSTVLYSSRNGVYGEAITPLTRQESGHSWQEWQAWWDMSSKP